MTVDERLEKLERGLIFWRNVTLVLVPVLAVTVLLASVAVADSQRVPVSEYLTQGEIRARRLEIVDEHENVLVSIGRTKAGGIVGVYNALGKRAAAIQANKHNVGALSLHDVNGEPTNILVAQ